jgi:hypothetical protein
MVSQASAPVIPWAPWSDYQGSIQFNAGANSRLEFAGHDDWALGTDDFTIEWWQWMTPQSAINARIFAVGTFNTQSIGVSMESGSWTFWAGPNLHSIAQIPTDSWHHLAISRASGHTRFFLDGVDQVGADFTTVYDVNQSSTALTMGNEGNHDAPFDGFITNFHWVKGTAKYTGSFALPDQSPEQIPDTKLLLLSLDFNDQLADATGNHNSDQTGVGLTWAQYSPLAQTALLDISNGTSWNGNDSIWHDLTPFGSDGTVIGDISMAGNDPNGGQSLDFGSNGFLQFTNNNPLSTCADKVPATSINFWIKFSPPGHHAQIGGCRQTNGASFYLLILHNGYTEARLVTNESLFDININYAPYFNSWHFVSFVAQPSRTDLYIDGVHKGDNPNVYGTFNTITDFHLGSNQGLSFHADYTLMGYCSVYDRSLSPAEVRAEYDNTKSYYGH